MTHPIQALRDELRDLFVDRDRIIDGMLTALVAGEHVLLLGPAGTAKSMLARALCERLEGGSYFQWLLTRFSTPEELFGPVSLTALEQGRYERIVTDKLPEAHVAFLDEIFKANSAILNSLLSILNERTFHNGQEAVAVPLVTLIGASNEIPDEEELVALYDRFLVRYALDYIEDDVDFLRMLTLPAPASPHVRVTFDELAHWRAQASEIPIPESVLADLVSLRRSLSAQGIVPSDRRYRRALGVLRAHAFVCGRDAIELDDLHVLADVLWTEPDERTAVAEAVAGILDRFDNRIEELATIAEDVFVRARRPRESAAQSYGAAMEAMTKITQLRREVYEVCEAAATAGRMTSSLERKRDRLDEMLAELLAETTAS